MIRRARRATQRDVAAKAGVSRVAVSVVLSGSSSTVRVAEATRERILAAAAELGYLSNHFLRTLLHPQPERRRTGIIGLYTGEMRFRVGEPFYAALLAGIQDACADLGLDLLLRGRGSEARDAYPHEAIQSGKIDGLLCYVHSDDQGLADIRSASVPVVSLVEAVPGIPSVMADESAAGQLMADHLAAQGVIQVLWRGAAPNSTNSQQREHAFIEACHRRHLMVNRRAHNYARPAFDADELACLHRHAGQVAVVGFSDHVAEHLLVLLDSMGYRIPDQVRVAGFDGINLWLTSPPRWQLTTIDLGWSEVARTAVHHLHRLIAGDEVPRLERRPVRLWRRETA